VRKEKPSKAILLKQMSRIRSTARKRIEEAEEETNKQ